MPSEQVATAIDRTLARPAGAFRSALTDAIEEVRGLVASLDPQTTQNGEECSAELGEFAAGRIEFSRFNELFSDRKQVDPQARKRMQLVLDALLEFGQSGDLSRVELGAGSSLCEAVRSALFRVGQVFGAARVAGLTRSGAYDPSLHDRLLTEFPHFRWSAAERSIAPPVIVEGDGRDMRVEGLAEFLDGRQKIVLLIKSPIPPAPLARLITPGTFVIQTHDPSRLAGFAEFEGPGIAALVPETAARFVHDPRAGASFAERLAIEKIPSDSDVRSIEGASPAWQRDSLNHLRSLSACAGSLSGGNAPPGPDGSPPSEPPSAPIDRLAAWLVHQADLENS